MSLTRDHLILLAAGGSAAMLLGAWAFQYIGGLAPCPMCLWQRYPHAVAVVVAGVALALQGRLWPLLGALAALATAGIGVYHTGVERGIFEGPDTCTAGSVGDLSVDELMNQIMAAPSVLCNEVAWEMFGLSMATWNALISFGLAGLWGLAAFTRR